VAAAAAPDRAPALPGPEAAEALAAARPAELVDLSESVYQQVFAVGMWVSFGCGLFALSSSLLQPAGSRLAGLLACGVWMVVTVVSAKASSGTYRLLRRCPWLLAAVGAALGLTAFAVGPHNFQLFLPIVSVLSVAGVAARRRVVLVAAAIAGVGLGAPQLLYGAGDLAGATLVWAPPLVFWLMIDRIAAFTLRLHLALVDDASPPHSVSPTDPERDFDPGRPARRVRAGLPNPGAVDVAGVRLTSRQLQVIMLACEGLRHAEIASCLGIGIGTARRHVVEARRRTGTATTPQLVAWAQRVGLVGPRRRR
jgi:DNA-binding CsgD family transcriptional regulator